ncbi:E3 ubiquitin-protein ligase DZIP3-like [Rhincodon typus]|uniref:E3 ubiquitin-protein ligase DZIP3-like n=1 Tax=Rhincodon typus TaxID=259920 RepID=UPI00202F7431|nr:E3 ubiquitin-protein ligase DZIP3-like [Rhincodon typus]
MKCQRKQQLQVSKAKTKSKKKKKKSKGKKAQTNEDSHNITQDITSHQHETLSIPVQENQVDDSRSKKQVANSSCDVSTFSASVATSSQLAFGTMPNNSNAGPFLTSHDINKLDDLPDQTYQSDGELDDIENPVIDEESTGSSVCTSSDLYSSSSVGDRTINVQEQLWQNVKEKSEMRQKLLALQNENQSLVRNLEQLITKLKEEQQQRIRAENQYSRLQEHYQLEISRVNQQLQSKDEEIKKITTQFANERTLWNKDKAKLEDVSAKNIAKLVEATKRAVAAEILFLECRRDNGLFQLQQAEQDCSVRLRTAEENLTGPFSSESVTRTQGLTASTSWPPGFISLAGLGSLCSRSGCDSARRSASVCSARRSRLGATTHFWDLARDRSPPSPAATHLPVSVWSLTPFFIPSW